MTKPEVSLGREAGVNKTQEVLLRSVRLGPKRLDMGASSVNEIKAAFEMLDCGWLEWCPDMSGWLRITKAGIAALDEAASEVKKSDENATPSTAHG